LKAVNKFFVFLFCFQFVTPLVYGQSESAGGGLLFYSIVGVSVLLLIWALLTLASNLMKIEADKHGLDSRKNNFGIIPGLRDIFGASAPEYVTSGRFIKLDKGHDIKLLGEATGNILAADVQRFAIMPQNFNYFSPIPKLEVVEGDDVLAGSVLFYDKKRPEIKYVSPVSGEIVEVRRGDKRSIASVVILADKEIKYKKLSAPDLSKANREEIVNFLLGCGGWSMINERPFDIVPDPSSIPVNIFISTFDTAPLAPDLNLVVNGKGAEFQKGLDVLTKLTSGKVFLGLDARSKTAPSSIFTEAQGVEKNWFSGKHPAGNVGIQIHHIAPLKSGEKVWTLGVQEVITLGGMFLNEKYDASRVVALTGGELKNPSYVRTYQGASIAELLKNNVNEGNVRYVSGDVLSGHKVDASSFLNFRDDQVTVLKEGDNYELFGWLLPIKPRPSISGTFPNFLYPNHKFEAETNTHGEKRAFVVSGAYESVLPMDIYPMHLMKAIITNDFEKMEGLGINELSEEDIALCEFVCVSKTPLQSILRQGLDIAKEQS
jgi:Na+-transporting NADH:ubiquinone oxidoreductase subunit A